MSELQNFLSGGGDAALRRVNNQAESAGSLYSEASWDKVGKDKDLTDFLHLSLDPNGSKYNGNSDALKEDLLNTTTAKNSSVLASIWDFAKSTGENTQKRRFENLISRLYEDAPNRLFSGNANDTYQAVKSGLLGGAIYDAPLLVATGGLGKLAGLGAKGLEAAGTKMLGESAAKLAATDLGADAVGQAVSQLGRNAVWSGFGRGVVREGAENAAFGIGGDLAQQGANMNRGNQDEFSTAQAVTAALMGGSIGAVAGGISGGFEGRAMAKKLTGELPGATGKIVAEKSAADAAALAASKAGEVPSDMVTLRDAYNGAKSNLESAAADVEILINGVTHGLGDAKSKYTVPELEAIRKAMTDASSSHDMAETLRSQAASLRALEKQTPESVAQAAELEHRANSYEQLIHHLLDTYPDENASLHTGASWVNGDVNPKIVSELANFNPELAAVLGQRNAPPPTAAAPKPKAGGAAPAAGGTPTPPPGTPPAGTGGAAGAAPSAPSAAAAAAPEAPTPTQAVAESALPPPPQTPTAKDVATMAETKFSDDEKAALVTLNEALGKANMQLQDALTSMETNGLSQVVADVSKAAGVDRGPVQDAMQTVTAATQREYNKAVVEHDAAVATAKEKATAQTEKATAQESAPTPGEATQFNQAQLDIQAGLEAAQKVQQEIEALTAKVDGLKAESTQIKAVAQYEQIKANLDGQIKDVSDAMDAALGDIKQEFDNNMAASGGDKEFSKLSKEDKAAIVKSVLADLKEKFPDVAPLIDQLDETKITSKQGVEKAKLKLRELADHSVSWAYAKAIGDVLPDSLNVGHFDAVLKAVLSAAPEAEVARISKDYRQFVKDALLERINAIGLKAVMADKDLGPAWQRLLAEEGGHQKFGGASTVAGNFNLVEMAHSYTGELIKAAGEANVSMGDTLREGLPAMVKVARDTMRMLRASGIPMDSKFMEEAIHIRLKAAVREAVDRDFYVQNKGDFDKLAKLREMREEGRTSNETQSLNLHRLQGSTIGNPITTLIYNKTGEGDWYSRNILVSGRKQLRDKSGNLDLSQPQSILSDGISDYLGTLWAHPRKMFAAASMARDAIYTGAVDAASWGRGSMVIDGIKLSGSMKELKGAYKEMAAARMAQSRWALILDAAERRRLPETDTRALPGDMHKAQLERIGEISNPVTEAELSIAELFLDSRERIANEKAVAQSSLAEVLSNSKTLGATDSAKINAIVDRLNVVLKKNSDSTIEAMNGHGLAAEKATTRSRTRVVRDANGKPVLDSEGKVTVVKENSEKGSAETQKTREKKDADQAKASSTTALTVTDKGEVVYGKNDTNIVTIKSGGKSYEFAPKDALSFASNGDALLYGQKIGTWEKLPNGRGITVLSEGIPGGSAEISEFSSLAKRKTFIEHYRDIFDANTKKMTEASEATASLPEGSHVSLEQSNTSAVKEAVAQLQQPGKIAEADLDKTMESFAAKDGFILVMKSATGAEARSPGPRQGGMTVRAFAKLIGIAPEDVRLGYVEEKLLKSGELRGKSMSEKLGYPGVWTGVGAKLPTADSKVVEQVLKRKENAPMVLEAQNRPISLAEAEKIVLSDGQTLAYKWTEFKQLITGIRFSSIKDLERLNSTLTAFREIAERIEALAPHGIREEQASRATSFHALQQRMAQFPENERRAALDMLRRMDSTGRGLPEFHPGAANEFSVDGASSKITLTETPGAKLAGGVAADAGLPKHVVVAHEVGHWAFYNLLSPSEQVQFIESFAKFFDADGKFSSAKMMETMPAVKKLEKATGIKFDNLQNSALNEAFAWGFTSHVLRNMSEGAVADTLWSRVTKLVKNVLSHFLDGKVDPDLVPLFEKIMPSRISDTKYGYSSFLERATGKVGDVAEFGGKAKEAGQVISVMQNIDELRGKLRQHLFIPGAVADAGFAEDLRAAANHMFGLLYGRGQDGFLGKLRGKLNPYEHMSKAEAIAKGLTDEWVRGSDGKPIKFEGKGVHVTKLREGIIDHTQLFRRSERGALVTAINDIMPPGAGAVSDQIAFEAVEASEKFAVILRDSSIGGNAAVQYAFDQGLQQEFKRITGLEMKDTPITDAAKYSDALARAEAFAYKAAEDFARTENGVDIADSLFDAGTVIKLGTDQQREVFAGVARSLHDLMSDALTYLETEVRKRGVEVKAVDRTVDRPAAEVSKAAEPAVAKMSRKKAEPTIAPTTEKGVEVATSEANERVDGVTTGVPVAADPQVQSVVARVPHRDPDQAGVIGTAMTRLIKFITKGEELTNGDIARITGVALEDGYKAEGMVNSTTEAFDALRKGLRWVSENMTSPTGKPKLAMDYIADLLLADRMDTIVNDIGADILHGEKLVPVTKGFLRGELVKVIKGEPVDDMLYQHLNDILIDTTHILSGTGTTAAAKRMVGATVAVDPLQALRFSDGSYYPGLVKASVSNRLRGLTQRVGSQLVELLGFVDDGDTAGTLSRNVVYRIKGTDKFFTTADEMAARTDSLIAKAGTDLMNSHLEIGQALASGDSAEALRLMKLYEAHSDAPGVIPAFLDMSKVYDPVMASDDLKLAVQAASVGKSEKEALKSMGYIGVQKGEQVNLFSVKSAKDMERTLSAAVGMAKADKTIPDTPISGELALGLIAEDATRPNPLALEQRAILAGAPKAIAEILSRPFKAMWDKAPLSAEDAAKVKAHWGIQLSSNSARIRKVGGEWLANLIAPEYGTGFEEALTTKLSSQLMPLVKGMDQFALGKSRWSNNWAGKSAYEIYRNMDMRQHAIPQSDAEARIVMAMRTGDDSILSAEERVFKERLNTHFRDRLTAQRDAGIPVGDVTDATNRNYLPQRFNLDWIQHNREDAIGRLTEFFQKDRMGRPNVGEAGADASRVINEAINRDELKGVLDGASSTYTQAFGEKLHQRKLHIVGKDWERMHPLFDNNLRSLTTAYTETAAKRIEWANTFGVRGHAAETYTDIAERGADAAMDALMGKAGGMKRVLDRPGSESDMVGQYSDKEAQREIEAVESLFSAATSDPTTAGKLVKEIMDALDKSKDVGTRANMAKLLTDYHTQNGGFGQAEFAKRAASIVNGLADFGENGSSVARHDVNFMRQMVGVLGGRPAYTISANHGMRDMAGAVKAFNSVTLLSTAVLGSLADPAMSLMRSGSIRDWMKGMTSSVKLAMNDSAYVEAMHRVGVTMESVIHENLSNMSGGVTGRFTNAYFNANMLTPWTNAQRQMAALVGYESIRANQNIALRERMTGNVDSWAYRKSMKYLRELGLGYLATSEKLGEFPVAVQDQKVSQAIHKFTNESVFQPNRNDMPLWTQDPIASIMWQFKSYPTMMGRLAKKNVKDAFSFDKAGKYDGDPMGLAYLVSVGAAFGLGASAVKDTVLGKNAENPENPHSPKTYTISKMVQDMGYKDFDLNAPGADAVAGGLVQGLLSLGAMGFVGDLLVQSAKSLDNGAFGRERMMSQIFGPTVGTFSDLIQIADGARKATQREDDQEYGSSQERTAVRKVVSRIPVVGRVDPWVDTFVNATAGPLENPPEQKF